jgi:D-sedoheptulose 7-phosphate isomerase
MKFSNNQYLKKYISNFSELLTKSFDKDKIEQSNKIFKKIKKSKKKIIIIGNGGSAAIASHACVDYLKVAKIKSVNFNDPSLFTCFANDFGHDRWMEEAIKHYGDKGDLLISISSSGMSKNIINACKAARKKKFLSIITLTGFSKNNSVKKFGNINFWVDSKVYNFVENIHQIIILAISDFFSNTKIR